MLLNITSFAFVLVECPLMFCPFFGIGVMFNEHFALKTYVTVHSSVFSLHILINICFSMFLGAKRSRLEAIRKDLDTKTERTNKGI